MATLSSLRPLIGVSVLAISHRLHPGCVLISERLTSLGRGTLQLPGGHLEYGESFEECARRELKEETNLDCTPSSPLKLVLVTNSMFASKEGGPKQYVTLFMRAEIDDDSSLKWMEPDQNTEWTWAKWSDLKNRKLFDLLKNAVDDPLFNPYANIDITEKGVM